MTDRLNLNCVEMVCIVVISPRWLIEVSVCQCGIMDCSSSRDCSPEVVRLQPCMLDNIVVSVHLILECMIDHGTMLMVGVRFSQLKLVRQLTRYRKMRVRFLLLSCDLSLACLPDSFERSHCGYNGCEEIQTCRGQMI